MKPNRNQFSLEVYEIKIIVPICWGFKAEDKFKVTLREGDKTSGKLFNQEIGIDFTVKLRIFSNL